MASAPITTLRGSNADYLKVGRGIAPGIVKSITVKRAHDVDKKKGGGTTDKKVTTNGEKFAEVQIVLYFWQDDWADEHDQALAFDENGIETLNPPSHEENEIDRTWFFIDSLFPKGTAPAPYDVSHPVLALHRIKSLFFESFDGPKMVGPGEWEITLSAFAYEPPVAKPKSATSTPGTAKPLKPGATQDAIQELAVGKNPQTTPNPVPDPVYWAARKDWEAKNAARQAWLKKWQDYQFGLGPNPGDPPPDPGDPPTYHPKDPAASPPPGP